MSPMPSAMLAVIRMPSVKQQAEAIIRRKGLCDTVEPDELVNHVWIKVATAIERDSGAFDAIDTDESRRRYIRRALNNAATDFLRQRKRAPQLLNVLPDVITPEVAQEPDKAELVARIVEQVQSHLGVAARCRLEVVLNGQGVAAYAAANGITLQAAQQRFVRGKDELCNKITEAMINVFGHEDWRNYVGDVGLATLASLVDVKGPQDAESAASDDVLETDYTYMRAAAKRKCDLPIPVTAEVAARFRGLADVIPEPDEAG